MAVNTVEDWYRDQILNLLHLYVYKSLYADDICLLAASAMQIY